MRSRRDQPRYSAALAAALLWIVCGSAQAQVATHPPASGRYEGWSSLRMTAYGPLGSAPAPLAERIEVETHGTSVRVVHQPEGRVVWVREQADAEGPRGMGIEFETLDDRTRSRINDLVRELRTQA